MSHRIARPRTPREEIALGWIMRIQDPAFEDWPELSEWLAEDEENSTLFDQLCIADHAVQVELGDAPTPKFCPPSADASAARARHSRERVWAATAGIVLFATLLFVLVVLPLIRPA